MGPPSSWGCLPTQANVGFHPAASQGVHQTFSCGHPLRGGHPHPYRELGPQKARPLD